MKRISLGLLAGATLLVPPQAQAAPSPEADSRSALRAQVLRLKHQNQTMQDRLEKLEGLLQQVLQNQARPATRSPAGPPRQVTPPPPVPESPPPPEEEPLSEEEARLAAEFAAEFGSSEPEAPAPAPVQGPATAPSSGSSFWGTGGILGQGGTGLDIGLASELIIGSGDRKGVNHFSDTATLRETELSLGGYVDPYHRADALLVWNAAHDEVAIEEGYLTFFNLPEGWRARVGKFRSRFGKNNGLHLADLPWIDFPLVYEKFLGHEGFGAPGARLTYLGEGRGKWSWSMDLEGFRGANEHLVDPLDLAANKDANGDFDEDRFARNIILAGRLQNNFQLDETTDLELGYSRMLVDKRRVKFDGLDLTWRKLNQPGRNEWKLQLEGFRSSREDLVGSGNDDRTGWYAWADRRFDRNRAAGFRVDHAENLAAGAQADDSWLAYFTYYPTEFTWYRLQYQEETEGATNLKDKRVMLQFRWQLGVDRHALQ